MKKRSILFLGLTIIFFFISCGINKNPHHSPKSITKAYAESLYTGRFDEAKTYVTPESVPIINFFQQAFPPEHFNGCKQVTLDEITVKRLTDSTAICKCIIHLCNGRTGNENAKVLKRDGKWYVTLKDIRDENDGKMELRNNN